MVGRARLLGRRAFPRRPMFLRGWSKKWSVLVLLAAALLLSNCAEAGLDLTGAAEGDAADEGVAGVGSIQLLGLLTVMALAPAFLIMVTSFTRIIVVLSLVRNAIGVPQLPPNQVLLA